MTESLEGQTGFSRRGQLVSIWEAGIAAVSPGQLVNSEIENNTDLKEAIRKCRRIILLGGGKAARQMVLGALSAIPREKPVIGQVNVIEGEETELAPGLTLRGVRPPGQNFPTPHGVESTGRQLELVRTASREDLALVLLSGGASAMMPLPVQGVTLEEKLQTTKLLHASGATIQEMNTVRTCISQVKGGRLANPWQGDRGRPTFWTLAISDVVGDPPEIIGSGPTISAKGGAREALEVIDKLSLASSIPGAVLNVLREQLGQGGVVSEMPWARYVLVGNNRKAVLACKRKARELGWPVLDLGSHWEMEVRDLALLLTGLVTNVVRDEAPQSAPLCVLGGGETQLKLIANPGPGGRNQHLALLMTALMERGDLSCSSWLFAGSDGEDGPTTAAGGFADRLGLNSANQKGVPIHLALASFSSNQALEKIGALFSPGATGTNVADLWIGLISPEKE